MTPWEIQADEFVNCNCSYGCPCQFNALPTHGNCQAIAAFAIGKGHFGEVRLDGLNVVGVFAWPGPIHEGDGEAFLIVDERADADQRAALLSILAGENTEPGKTVWNVFAATFSKIHEPAFKPISIDIDVEKRTGRVAVEELVEMSGEPIRNPVSGEEHRARIQIDGGFEYTTAEMGSGSGRANGPVKLDLKDSYGQFAHIHLNNHGIVR
ncbi:MAG: DUF1326 domain-containing protein [Dichotomicrobium sp.]